MGMQDTARSRALQDQQRRMLARNGTWENAVRDDSIVRRLMRIGKQTDKKE